MREIGIDRRRFDIKVGGEVFTLSFIPNLARKRYIDFWQRVEAMMEAVKIGNKEERRQAIDALSDDNEDVMLHDIIATTLEANGYEYDWTWWEENTDAEMQLEFVRAVIEEADTDKKKVLEVIEA